MTLSNSQEVSILIDVHFNFPYQLPAPDAKTEDGYQRGICYSSKPPNTAQFLVNWLAVGFLQSRNTMPPTDKIVKFLGFIGNSQDLKNE